MSAKRKRPASTGHLFDVHLKWRAGEESNITVRARSAEEAKKKAREFALSRTGTRPTSCKVRRIIAHV